MYDFFNSKENFFNGFCFRKSLVFFFPKSGFFFQFFNQWFCDFFFANFFFARCFFCKVFFCSAFFFNFFLQWVSCFFLQVILCLCAKSFCVFSCFLSSFFSLQGVFFFCKDFFKFFFKKKHNFKKREDFKNKAFFTKVFASFFEHRFFVKKKFLRIMVDFL